MFAPSPHRDRPPRPERHIPWKQIVGGVAGFALFCFLEYNVNNVDDSEPTPVCETIGTTTITLHGQTSYELAAMVDPSETCDRPPLFAEIQSDNPAIPLGATALEGNNGKSFTLPVFPDSEFSSSN